MKKSFFNITELSGIPVCMAAVSFLRDFYIISKKSTLGVLLGSVNNSIWEQMKPIILCYILYSGIELLILKPYFKRFVSAKALGVYAAVITYLLSVRIIPDKLGALVTLAAIVVGFLVSKYLTLWEKDISGMFSVACFMLLLIFIMYFSFTAFPLRLDVFLDRELGMYGIIPEYIDTGAGALVDSC